MPITRSQMTRQLQPGLGKSWRGSKKKVSQYAKKTKSYSKKTKV